MHPAIEAHLPQLRDLCRRHQVARLDLFGSGATERFNPATSDLDFVVEFFPGPRGAVGGDYFAFKRDLQVLFGRKVDLLEPVAIRNRYLRAEVEETKVRVYAA